jgi:hypothetical protein
VFIPPTLFAPSALIIAAIAFAFVGISAWSGRRRLWRERRRNLLIWRKRHGINGNRRDTSPPMPFHVSTKLGGDDNPYAGISTRDIDNFLAAIRLLFGSEEDERKRSTKR